MIFFNLSNIQKLKKLKIVDYQSYSNSIYAVLNQSVLQQSITSLTLHIRSWDSNVAKSLHYFTLLTELNLECSDPKFQINQVFNNRPFRFCLRNLSLEFDKGTKLSPQFFYEITELKYLKIKLFSSLDSLFEEIFEKIEFQKIYNQVIILDINFRGGSYFNKKEVKFVLKFFPNIKRLKVGQVNEEKREVSHLKTDNSETIIPIIYYRCR